MTASVPSTAQPLFVPVGDNPARVFSLDARTRARRLAAKAGLDCGDQSRAGQAAILADLDFTWDPAWLKAIAARPGAVLTLGNRAVLAHVAAHQDPAPLGGGDAGQVGVRRRRLRAAGGGKRRTQQS